MGAQAPGRWVKVCILTVKRHPVSYNRVLGDELVDTRLRSVKEKLRHASTDPWPEGGPALFARPSVLRLVREKLQRQPVTLGNRPYMWTDLKIWHIVVEEDMVENVKTALRTVPSKHNVHVTTTATVEIEVQLYPHEMFGWDCDPHVVECSPWLGL